MKKTILFILIGAVVIALLIITKITNFSLINNGKIVEKLEPLSPLNTTVEIEGEIFSLKNGIAEKEIAPGATTKNTLRVFGEPLFGDLDNDEDLDATLLLQNDSGGSGIFYYAVLSINNNENGYKNTNTLYLGERIAPQTVEIHDGKAVFNFAERKIDEPMTTRPSIGKSFWVNFDKNTGKISELVKDPSKNN